MSVLRVNKIAASGQTSENTGSVFFDGTGDYLSIPNSSDFVLGPSGSNFTIELYLYATSSPNGAIVSTYSDWDVPSTGYLNRWALVFQTNSIKWFGSDGNGIITEAAILNQWVHYAICRNGSTITMYRNGTSIGTQTTKQDYTSTNPLFIGYINNYGDYNGYISNLRIIKGTALYTSNFTPPTRELEVTPETVLVACHDGENIFAEKTGKIIAAYGDRSSGIHTVGESPIGITTFQPGLTRSVDVTAGPVLQGNLEYNSQNFLVLPKGTTEDRNRTGGRAVFGGGTASPGSSNLNSIEFISISTQGNAQDFGDLLVATRTKSGGGVSSPTRGVTAGGFDGGNVSRIEYVNIATTGNSVDFGATLLTAGRNIASASNSTRGLFAGGDNRAEEIDFITIATLGTCSSFGAIPSPGNANHAGLASPTRAVFGGGYRSGAIDKIEFVTIATLGAAADFDDLTVPRFDPAACSSPTRGIFAGGSNPTPTQFNTIDYITIASTGQAKDFGDLITAKHNPGGTSNSIRGVFAGGSPAFVNTIEFVTIASTGDAKDFGDLIISRGQAWSCSDSHGGIS